MRRWLVIALVAGGIAATLAFAVWAIVATQAMGSWTGGSKTLLETIVGAAIFTGALTGGLMWLAFYSSRRGFDEPFRPDGPETSTKDSAGSRADDDN
jgi:hypothetical protein